MEREGEISIEDPPATFKSFVWQHFGFPVEIRNGERVTDKTNTICKHCKKTMSYRYVRKHRHYYWYSFFNCRRHSYCPKVSAAEKSSTCLYSWKRTWPYLRLFCVVNVSLFRAWRKKWFLFALLVLREQYFDYGYTYCLHLKCYFCCLYIYFIYTVYNFLYYNVRFVARSYMSHVKSYRGEASR